MSDFNQIVTYPLTWIAVTITVFVVCDKIYRFSKHFPLFNPVLMSVLAIICILKVSGVSYSTYFIGARPIHLLLGPATVALAVPLYLNLDKIRAYFWPIIAALLAGSLAGIVSALSFGQWLGLDKSILLSFSPKSCTTPIAMALSAQQGGLPSLTANAVLLAGVCGAVIAIPLFKLLKIRNEVAQGFALGMAAHGVGTARAWQISATAGAFAGLAIGLNGVVTSLILPWVLMVWFS